VIDLDKMPMGSAELLAECDRIAKSQVETAAKKTVKPDAEKVSDRAKTATKEIE
jgi:hypothetical protein